MIPTEIQSYPQGYDEGFQAGVASVVVPEGPDAFLYVGLGGILGCVITFLIALSIIRKLMNQLPNPFAR